MRSPNFTPVNRLFGAVVAVLLLAVAVSGTLAVAGAVPSDAVGDRGSPETATPSPSAETNDTAENTRTTTGSGPGFDVAAAFLALLAATFLASSCRD